MRLIDRSILAEDLNSEVGLPEFFHAFGYKPEDKLYLRMFRDDVKSFGVKKYSSPALINNFIPTLSGYNQKNYGVFWVVNGGGDGDPEVIASGGPARAQFSEIDPSDDELERVNSGEITIDDLLANQIDTLAEFSLEPSVIVRTWKSLHCYWLLDDGDIMRFRPIQRRMVELFHSDSTIQNESRVMRIPGFEHRKHDPVLVKLIKFDPDLRYTQDQIETALDGMGIPREIPKASTTTMTAADPGEKIPKGKRYRYVMSRIGFYAGKFGKGMSAERILNDVYEDFRECCEDPDDIAGDFREDYLPVIIKFQENSGSTDSKYWRENVLAWEDEHPGEKFDSTVVPWAETIAAGERARAAEKRFDEGLKEFKARQAQKAKEDGSGSSDSQKSDKPTIKLMSMSDIEEEEVDWLIPGYIPAGQISLLAGDGGQGKTSVWCNLVAGVSSGRRTIFSADNPFQNSDDVIGDQKTCLVFSSEDSVSKVLRKRLRRAGADLTRVLCMDLADKTFDSIKFDSPELARIIAEIRPALAVFDPLQSFIPPTVQMGARNQMRQCLSPLAALGEKYGTTFIIVMHTNKKQGVWGRTRCADSADIWDIARSVLIVGHTGEGEVHYLSHEKSNYGEQKSTILYEINDGLIEFKGSTTKRDREYVSEYAQAMRTAPAKAEAKEIIMNLLGDGEEHRVSEIDDAVKASGISEHTMRRAKAELKTDAQIKYRCEGYGKQKTFFVRRTNGEKSYEETA